MNLPSSRNIVALHKKYAMNKEIFKLTYVHCQIVSDIALSIVDSLNSNVNRELIRVGALLHDIGVYKLYDSTEGKINKERYIRHGITGYKLLKSEGFNDKICRFASHHTGVGLTKADIIKQNLDLPLQNFLAESEEEQVVMYADKFHSKTEPPYFNSYEWSKKYITKFGKDKVAEFEQMAQEFGLPHLRLLVKKYGHHIRD